MVDVHTACGIHLDYIHDRNTHLAPFVSKADYDAAIAALRLLFKEMELSGNLGSKDYGWPKAITASRAILESQLETPVKPKRVGAVACETAEGTLIIHRADETCPICVEALTKETKVPPPLPSGCNPPGLYEIHTIGGSTSDRTSETGTEQALCEDCPPADYPTDATRCAPCPRRMPRR